MASLFKFLAGIFKQGEKWCTCMCPDCKSGVHCHISENGCHM